MNAEELDVALEELESRVERLRALYEQYFLGIEKIEPTVARKDVDRRIWLLRREQIRNTGKRFKLQTIIQRYNTFQQYWGRICREIENGTYKRHLLKAERTQGEVELLTIAARKRLGRQRRAAAEDDAVPPAEPAPPQPAAAPSASAASPLEAAKRAVDSVLGRSLVPTRSTTAPASPAAGATAKAQAASTASLSARTDAPSPAPNQPPARALGRLDLEMDFLDGPAPAPRTTGPKPAVPGSSLPKPAVPSAGAPRPAVPSAGAPRPAVPSAGAPRPAVPSAGAPRPAPPASPDAGPRAPQPAPRPTAPKPPPPARPSPPAGRAGETRVQQLHARLLEAKRQTNDQQQVSVDGLRKSLAAAEERLRKQHGDRKIDFDVVIKDGKAVVKPILR